MGLGCDTKKNVESKGPPDKSERIAVYEPSSEITVETSKQANTSTTTVSLKIDISGFAENNGACRVAIYLGKAHFNDPEYAIAKESVRIFDSKATWQVEIPIPLGTEQDGETVPRLAVSAYHDENENSRLDKNSFGIPTERYGFSNNPKRAYGPPKFSDAAIIVNSSEQPNNSKITFEVPIRIK